MADEFIKGFGIFVTSMLGWLIIAATFNTPSFEGTQLTAPNPSTNDVYIQIALILKDALFWVGVLGALTFWVVIPAIEEARRALAE
jgi:hypothetical protein